MTDMINNAVINRNCRILELLVAIPGQYSERDAERSLLLATQKGYADCVKVFLDCRMDPDMKEQSAKTLLMIASENGHADVVQLLVKARSNVNMRHRSGETALHFAARCGQESCVDELVKGYADVDAVDAQGNTPLLLASMNCQCNGTLKAMRLLVKSGCDLNVQDRTLRTALHYTSHKAMGTEMLLSAGAYPDLQDEDGNAPIHLAAIEGFDTIVCCLVTYNCNPDVVNNYGMLAVHYLAMKGHWKAIEDIAKVGGDLDKPDATGKIPLWYAVNHNRSKAVLTLLRCNCSPDPPTTLDADVAIGNPLGLALEKKLYVVAKQLLLSGCSSIDPLRRMLNDHDLRRRARAQRQEERSTLFRSEEAEEADRDEMEAVEWFAEWIHQPHSLRQSTRSTIRKNLRSKSLNGRVLDRLPQAMQDFVLLRELEEISIDCAHE